MTEGIRINYVHVNLINMKYYLKKCLLLLLIPENMSSLSQIVILFDIKPLVLQTFSIFMIFEM